MNADAILKRIEQDARQSAEATMDDARKRAEALSAARREKLSQEDEAAMAQARKDALALDDRLQRMAELDARKALLAEKRRVLDEAFALALEKMRKMPAARATEFALRTLLESGVPHRPMDILFTIREEGGLNGSANVDYGRLKAKYGVVLDASNDVGKIVSSAPGQIRIYADIYGRKAHAGSDPEKGVSAIQAAAVAVSRMRLQRIDEETTANIGTLSCEGETNVVQDHVTFAAETRSKSLEKRKAQANHMVACLQEACDALGARLEYRLHHSYQSYGFPDDHPHVRRLMDACRRAGVEPWTTYTGGGTDGNNFNAHGIETVVLACGMEHEHTTQERIAIRNLADASQVVYQLMLPDA